MHATAFTPPISSHHPTWWAKRSTKGGFGRWRGTGCVSPSVCVPFHTLLSLSPSILCIWKNCASQKKPPHMKANVRGKECLWQSLIKGRELFWLWETTQAFFASRRLQVDSLYLIWRIEQENNYQLRSDKTCGVSRERDEKYSWCLQSLYPHAPLSAWADAMNEKLNLWQTRDVI